VELGHAEAEADVQRPPQWVSHHMPGGSGNPRESGEQLASSLRGAAWTSPGSPVAAVLRFPASPSVERATRVRDEVICGIPVRWLGALFGSLLHQARLAVGLTYEASRTVLRKLVGTGAGPIWGQSDWNISSRIGGSWWQEHRCLLDL